MEHFLPCDLFLSTKCSRIPSPGVELLFDSGQHYSAVDVTQTRSYTSRSRHCLRLQQRDDAAAGGEEVPVVVCVFCQKSAS